MSSKQNVSMLSCFLHYSATEDAFKAKRRRLPEDIFLNSETKVQIQRRSQENVQSECRLFISFCLVLGVPYGAGGHMQTRIAPLTNQ